MAYYAALLSLELTIDRIMTNNIPLIDHPNSGQLDSAFHSYLSDHPIHRLRKEVMDLGAFFDKRTGNSSEKTDALDDEMREAIYRLEDVLEAQAESNQPLRKPFNNYFEYNAPICHGVQQEILSFIQRIPAMKFRYALLRALPPEPVVPSAYSPATNFFTENNSQLVGLQDELDELKRLLLLTHERDPNYTRKKKRKSGLFLLPEEPDEEDELYLDIISIVGMAGIGKTTLARAACEDPDVWNRFNCRLFVPVGQNCRLEEVLLRILTQLNKATGDNNVNHMQNNHNEENLKYEVCEILKHKRCIIVLDDVWDYVAEQLIRYLPDNINGSRILLTSRIDTDSRRFRITKGFLDKAESWNLLRKKVFDTDPCPYELEKFGETIAEKCEGLPLAIISVGNHLAKTENRSIEYWESVADKGIASIIVEDDEVYKVLHPSYQYLREEEKAFFLYLGVFHQGCEIVASKLMNLLVAEGTLDYDSIESHEEKPVFLESLRMHNLIIVKQQRMLGYSYDMIKTCNLHIVYWCYCKTRASKENLFHILQTHDDFVEGIRSQRRLCIHNNTLFGIKDSYDSLAKVSNLRSLLCTGPYHKYPIPFRFSLMLLRVLEAVSIRFFAFPREVLNLVRLRYIALTYDGDLPTSISQLINLWYLIVRRHVRIISPNCPSYLPLQIWNMKELRHLQVEGSDLPEPPPNGARLENLRKLLDVTPRSCSEKVLDRIPNLRKLGIQIVLPVDSTEPLISLGYIRKLDGLKSLKCDVVNPKPSSGVAARAYPTSIFPKYLERLSLSGFGYSWDQMSEISVLPSLRKLKLRHCAFQGPSWEVRKEEFPALQFLLLEDIDLRYWNSTDSNSFRWLTHLIIRHCYKLEQIPLKELSRLMALEIVDCKPSVADSVESLFNSGSYLDDWFNLRLLKQNTLVVSSWED